VLVRDVCLINEVEQLVPTAFTMGSQTSDCTAESRSGKVYVSLRNGSGKVACLGPEGKLYLSPLIWRQMFAKRQDDFPNGMVKRGPQVVNDVATNQTDVVYDGFIAFDSKGAFAGLTICVDGESERSPFFQKFVKFVNVFLGPSDL
jgi:hypothetical protein